jgi:hypothetical protein
MLLLMKKVGCCLPNKVRATIDYLKLHAVDEVVVALAFDFVLLD